MHVNYCTLFDSNYLDKGLALCYSLERVSVDYTLFIFAFDELTHRVLKEKSLPNVYVLREDDLLDEELRGIKRSRSRAEWCWTCSAVSIDFLLNKYELDNCVYLDSDLFFFSDPCILVEELIQSEGSVLITEHRFKPGIESFLISHLYGKYCVQFNVFINNNEGRRVLSWWKSQCLQDCSINNSYSVYGDQKYQDKFLNNFNGVHVLRNEGGGLAPWNISQYMLGKQDEKLLVINKYTGKKSVVVFYHFQGLETYSGGLVNISVYRWSGKGNDETLLRKIYTEYYIELEKIQKNLVDMYNLKFDKQSEKIKKEKVQNKRDSSLKRRMGQIVIGILSYFRIKKYGCHDLIYINTWTNK